MTETPVVINGHFRKQDVTGVQRYAREVVRGFRQKAYPHRYVEPPASIASNTLRQLWMQTVMPLKIRGDELLWSPTNIGPVFNENQVITLHDISDQLYPQWFEDRYTRWRSLILPPLLKRVKGIITVSEYSKRTINEQFPQTKGKVQVIYNGVRTDHFYPREQEETDALRKGFNLQKPFILTVGSIDPRKNIDGILEAWNRLPADITEEVELVIAGGSIHTFSFEVDRDIAESVRFLGYVSDDVLPGLYSAAELFVYPSLFEGFGLPVLEAMACGTPVVTSNTSALKELAQGYALTVNPRKPEEIAGAIDHMIGSEELCEDLAHRGQQYAQGFQWNAAADKTYEYLVQKYRE
ncbi:glycosyltransferase family 4 protein [Fodinibius sediminis]|uniref:Glycosyltransferase involved in cell wall bisynthesis n=1 Tax=Fodinibius sediminis TaxID=1214077 RepID=A0A521BUR8_9BACT|nr:glycosyltransferase family 1 protein [Fodinibius sediminis]SMO50913.1 Glycosyltransferase involved in cell wall bisynthesis [Fodinibius sediminis]